MLVDDREGQRRCFLSQVCSLKFIDNYSVLRQHFSTRNVSQGAIFYKKKKKKR